MEADIQDESKTLLAVKHDDKSSNRGLKKGNMVKCRTCLLNKNKGNCSIMTKLLDGETIKGMMIKCVPQTLNSITDDNYICDKCLRCLVKCTKFIDSCLEIEEKIREGKVIFEYDRTDGKTTEMGSKSKDDAIDESISGTKKEKDQEKSTPNYTGKDLSKSKQVIEINEDCIESEDSNKIDRKQNELQIKGKRRRKTRKIEDSAADEEIEAYLAEEEVVEKQDKSINGRQCKEGKQMKSEQNSEKVEILEITTRRRQRRNVKREKSPKMEIIDKTLGMVVRTYQRKKFLVDTEGNEVDKQLHSIKKIEEHNESRARFNLRTYERKRNSQTTTNNNQIFKKDQVDVLDTIKAEKIDCDVVSSVNEHTLGSSLQTDIEIVCAKNEMNKSNDDSVHDISVEHDYIVLSEFENESVKNITLLNENGELISVDAHIEDVVSHELSEKVDQYIDNIELKCPSCLTHYKTRRGLCDHLEKFHNITQGEYIYHCQVCKKRIINSKEIFRHKNAHGWPCTLCNEKFSSVEKLNSHKKKHPQIYSCTDCGNEFKTKSKLEQHEIMHKLIMDLKQRKAKIPPKRYNCDLCPIVFRHPTRLREHKNIVHLKLKEYECHDCGKTFGSKRTLGIHHRVKHQDRKPFQCDLCGDSFKRADYLKTHSSVHRNEQHSIINTLHETKRANLFPSEFCGMALKKGVGSKKNPYTYAITRKYACDICGLKFQHQRTKFVHERSHNVDPDKKFICPVCWKRLSTREELDEHSKRHIGTLKKYECWLCTRTFSRNMLLENHILEVHTSEDEHQQELKVVKEAGNIEDYSDENQDINCVVIRIDE